VRVEDYLGRGSGGIKVSATVITTTSGLAAMPWAKARARLVETRVSLLVGARPATWRLKCVTTNEDAHSSDLTSFALQNICNTLKTWRSRLMMVLRERLVFLIPQKQHSLIARLLRDLPSQPFAGPHFSVLGASYLWPMRRSWVAISLESSFSLLRGHTMNVDYGVKRWPLRRMRRT
jgi:hypothetical protein